MLRAGKEVRGFHDERPRPHYHEDKRGAAVKELKDKVSVITGAASGIGRALAERCAQEGMKVVLADVELESLAKAEASLKASGATVLAVRQRCRLQGGPGGPILCPHTPRRQNGCSHADGRHPPGA
jgi:phosphoglycerate dehydrogenase-like enzyme